MEFYQKYTQTLIKRELKLFPSHKIDRVALISVSLALSHTQHTMDIGASASHTVPVYAPGLSLILTVPTHKGMARLSRPRWLVTYRDGLPVC